MFSGFFLILILKKERKKKPCSVHIVFQGCQIGPDIPAQSGNPGCQIERENLAQSGNPANVSVFMPLAISSAPAVWFRESKV